MSYARDEFMSSGGGETTGSAKGVRYYCSNACFGTHLVCSVDFLLGDVCGDVVGVLGGCAGSVLGFKEPCSFKRGVLVLSQIRNFTGLV
jgi:hypothetical protein